MEHIFLGITVRFPEDLTRNGVVMVKKGVEYPIRYYRRDKEKPLRIYSCVCTEDADLTLELIDDIQPGELEIEFRECACCHREFSEVVKKTFEYCPECIEYRADSVEQIEKSITSEIVQ